MSVCASIFTCLWRGRLEEEDRVCVFLVVLSSWSLGWTVLFAAKLSLEMFTEPSLDLSWDLRDSCLLLLMHPLFRIVVPNIVSLSWFTRDPLLFLSLCLCGAIFRCAVASLYEVVSVRPSVRRSVGPSVGPLIPRYFRRWKVRILGASCAVYPALFLFFLFLSVSFFFYFFFSCSSSFWMRLRISIRACVRRSVRRSVCPLLFSNDEKHCFWG